MKTGKIFGGIGLILLAVFLILDAVGVMLPITSAVGEISLLTVLAALILLSYAIARVCRGKIGEVFVPLAIIFMLFEKNIAALCGLESENIINNWLLLGCAILLWIGFAILFSGRVGKGKRRHVNVKSHGSFSSSAKYIDGMTFTNERVENDLGSLVIRFENADKYTGGGVLRIDNNLGSISIELPHTWRYVYSIDNSLGSISAERNIAPEDAPLITIKGENSLGSVTIKFV